MCSTDIQISFFNLNLFDLNTFEINKYLSIAEINKAKSFYQVSDQMNYIKRKIILKKLLSFYLNVEVSQIGFEYNRFGKPSLIQINSSQCINFSVSKSKNYVAYAFSFFSELGIDIEFVNNNFDGKEIAEAFFSLEEQQLINSYEKSFRYFPFFQTWTKREAYSKYIGLRIQDGFKEFDNKFCFNKQETINESSSTSLYQKFNEFIIKDQQLFLVNLYSDIANPGIIVSGLYPSKTNRKLYQLF